MTDRRPSRRLTARERELLRDAALFVLAGEWPWDTGDGGKPLTEGRMERDREALQRAADKLAR